MPDQRQIYEHTCINKAIKAAQETSSLTEPIQILSAAQSTKAKPNTAELLSIPQDPYKINNCKLEDNDRRINTMADTYLTSSKRQCSAMLNTTFSPPKQQRQIKQINNHYVQGNYNVGCQFSKHQLTLHSTNLRYCKKMDCIRTNVIS